MSTLPLPLACSPVLRPHPAAAAATPPLLPPSAPTSPILPAPVPSPAYTLALSTLSPSASTQSTRPHRRRHASTAPHRMLILVYPCSPAAAALPTASAAAIRAASPAGTCRLFLCQSVGMAVAVVAAAGPRRSTRSARQLPAGASVCVYGSKRGGLGRALRWSSKEAGGCQGWPLRCTGRLQGRPADTLCK